jgi:hypothetical protein
MTCSCSYQPKKPARTPRYQQYAIEGLAKSSIVVNSKSTQLNLGTILTHDPGKAGIPSKHQSSRNSTKGYIPENAISTILCVQAVAVNYTESLFIL